MDIYTPVVEESCGYQYLSCGESVIGSNVGYPSFAGQDSGDAVFMLTMWQAGQLTLSTCSSNTEFRTQITLYRGVPMNNGTVSLVCSA